MTLSWSCPSSAPRPELSKFKLVELPLQQRGHLRRIIDRVEFAHALPRLAVMVVEESNQVQAGEEAPTVVYVRDELPLEEFGEGLIAGDSLQIDSSNDVRSVSQGDETGHEEDSRRITELNLLNGRIADDELAFAVRLDGDMLDGESSRCNVFEIGAVDIEPFVDVDGDTAEAMPGVERLLAKPSIWCELRSYVEGI